MGQPQTGDILIRDAPALHPREFIVADAVTLRPLSGPFSTISEAVLAARRLAPRAALWRENSDDRGRALGPPTRLAFV